MERPGQRRHEPDRRELRQFGLLFGGLVALVFGLGLPWLFAHSFPLWPWLVGASFGAWALAAPLSIAPFYRLWMRFGNFMSRITTPLLMGLIFFVVITPVGLVRQAIVRDPLKRRFDPGATSYREPSERSPPENIENPY